MTGLAKTTKFTVFSLTKPILVEETTEIPEIPQQLFFDAVFDDFSYTNSCSKSILDRKSFNRDLALTYGEISSITPISEMFRLIRSHNNGTALPSGKFYDIGSGIGRPVVAAALIHDFDVCIGIELLPSLHNIALQVKDKYFCKR